MRAIALGFISTYMVFCTLVCTIRWVKRLFAGRKPDWREVEARRLHREVDLLRKSVDLLQRSRRTDLGIVATWQAVPVKTPQDCDHDWMEVTDGIGRVWSRKCSKCPMSDTRGSWQPTS